MYGVVLRAHPVHGVSHIQRKPSGEIAIIYHVPLQRQTTFIELTPLTIFIREERSDALKCS